MSDDRCPYAPICVWKQITESPRPTPHPDGPVDERAVRLDERRRIARQVAAAVGAGQVVALQRALKQPNLRRSAGLLVHELVLLLDQLEVTDDAA